MYQSGTELTVVVNNRPIDEYKHPQKTQTYYIEGRKGSTYKLRYKNYTARRQKIVLSVDGLNVMSGDIDWQRGYVVEPYASLVVPGWRKDSGNVAKFEFSSIKQSYNQHNDSGQAQNIGVIGCRVYNEVIKYEPPKVVYHYHLNNWPLTYSGGGGGWVNGGGGGWSSTIGSPIGSTTLCRGSSSHLGVAACNNSAAPAEHCFVNSAEQIGLASANVGTGWGENQKFETVNVYYDFEQNVFTTLVLFYDDRRGLIQRGINIREDRIISPQAFPNAFPNDGCPNPK
jgi:hypothetical protein